jgi:hypothetical protein
VASFIAEIGGVGQRSDPKAVDDDKKYAFYLHKISPL